MEERVVEKFTTRDVGSDVLTTGGTFGSIYNFDFKSVSFQTATNILRCFALSSPAISS